MLNADSRGRDGNWNIGRLVFNARWGQGSPSSFSKLMKRAKLTCKLATPELQERKRTVVKGLKDLIVEKQELANGYRYKFDGSDTTLDLLNTFIKTERLCCDFFEYQLNVSGDGKYCWLELTGPEGVKDFIKYEIEF